MVKTTHVQQYHLTVLTPVHVGSGFRKLKNIDFYTKERTTHIVDIDEVSERLATHPELLRQFEYLGDDFSIEDFLQQNERYLRIRDGKSYPVECTGRDFLEFERNGLGVPYIPGTSLKGAIRTAIFVALFGKLPEQKKESLLSNASRETNPGRAGQLIEKEVFGGDPNHDLLRILQVFDAHFTLEDLNLMETKIYSVSSHGELQPKRFSIFAESLKPQATSTVNIGIDRFLLSDNRARGELRFHEKLSTDFPGVARMINEHSRRLIKTELDFFGEHGYQSKFRGLDHNYRRLLGMVPPDDKGFVLRLGWGSGWKSMTGDYISDRWLEQIRRNSKLRMGRGHPLFPKTRRVGIRNNFPAYPLGWIKLEPVS